MSAVGENHVFVVPKKELYSMEDMDKWTKSDAYQEYTGFIESLNEAVRGKPLNHPISPSSPLIVDNIVQLLGKVEAIIDDTPLIDQPQRFGNKAFATFYHRLCSDIHSLLEETLPEKFHKAIPEISMYFTESVGNSTRIDYGSGHELSFIMFMYCLFRIGALDCNSIDDRVAAVTKIFNSYMGLVRKCQTKYNMEPAGSHGVWSLDDFQFVPFLWGSSQFVGNPRIEPTQFPDETVVERLSSEFMFIGCIQYILKVKSGPFHEHSNQLYNISGTATWSKINTGLIKMYKGEVLGKFPVAQHMLFGSLLKIQEFDSSKNPTKMSGTSFDQMSASSGRHRPVPSLGRALAARHDFTPPAPPLFTASADSKKVPLVEHGVGGDADNSSNNH